MAISILKILSVIIILTMMILLLLSVNHLLRGDFDSHQEDIDHMRAEVENDEKVITSRSVFREFVHTPEPTSVNPRNPHKS